MSKDIIIAILVSIAGHVGILFGGELFKDDPNAQVVEEEVPVIELMEMPPIEPDEPEVVENLDEAPPEPIEFAPPMQKDVPSVSLDTPFVQKLQPPPPPDMERPTGMISIPKARPSGNIGQGMKDLFNIADLDQAPTPRFRAKPAYPFEMRRAGIEGEVVVGFIVDIEGKVIQAYSVRSTQREFEQAAIQAVSRWTFRPGKKGGRPVNTRMQVPIVFSISDE